MQGCVHPSNGSTASALLLRHVYACAIRINNTRQAPRLDECSAAPAQHSSITWHRECGSDASHRWLQHAHSADLRGAPRRPMQPCTFKARPLDIADRSAACTSTCIAQGRPTRLSKSISTGKTYTHTRTHNRVLQADACWQLAGPHTEDPIASQACSTAATEAWCQLRVTSCTSLCIRVLRKTLHALRQPPGYNSTEANTLFKHCQPQRQPSNTTTISNPHIMYKNTRHPLGAAVAL